MFSQVCLFTVGGWYVSSDGHQVSTRGGGYVQREGEYVRGSGVMSMVEWFVRGGYVQGGVGVYVQGWVGIPWDPR